MFANRQQLISSTFGGSDSAVENLYSKIKMDSRHKKVKKLFEQHIEEKSFSSWSMKFAPFNNIEWGNKELDAGSSKTSVLQLP